MNANMLQVTTPQSHPPPLIMPSSKGPSVLARGGTGGSNLVRSSAESAANFVFGREARNHDASSGREMRNKGARRAP